MDTSGSLSADVLTAASYVHTDRNTYNNVDVDDDFSLDCYVLTYKGAHDCNGIDWVGFMRQMS